MDKGTIRIGTSGWHYKHWKNTFYPADIQQKNQLEFYTKHFKTVEINNSFYKLPTRKAFTDWRNETPADFIFSVKVNRYLTHMKKLILDEDAVHQFLEHALELQNKLGPILFQLPPGWKINLPRLESFLSFLPPDHRYVFEFRNKTWYQPDVYQILEKYNCAFCIYDLGHQLSPLKVTADFVYIRLHGPGDNYQGSYSAEMLQHWKERCIEWQHTGADVYLYFDNDEKGYAAMNAMKLQELLNEP